MNDHTIRVKVWMVHYPGHTSGPHFDIFAAHEANNKLFGGRGSVSQGFRMAIIDEDYDDKNRDD